MYLYILHNTHYYHCIYVCDVHQSDIHHRSVVVVCVIIIMLMTDDEWHICTLVNIYKYNVTNKDHYIGSLMTWSNCSMMYVKRED